MFDAIAPSYDLLNRLISLGLDRGWRAETVRRVRAEYPAEVLDLAAGTGDLSIDLAKALPQATVVAADISQEMLRRAQVKARKEELQEDILFVECDALEMPFRDDCFDVVTCAFGIRNFVDIPAALSQIHRVLRPGGMVAILELCEPRKEGLHALYRYHAFRIIPMLGRLIGRHEQAYRYLPQSIRHVPQREQMCAILRKQGWERVCYKTLFPDVCALYVAYKHSQRWSCMDS